MTKPGGPPRRSSEMPRGNLRRESRTLGLEEPPTPPKRRRVTETFLAQISGLGPQAFSELVSRLRPLDEIYQANVLLDLVQAKLKDGDVDGAKSLMRIFAALYPEGAQGET